jgi:hypothetical protein
MKLPSINYLITSATSSLKRFPLTILSALIAVILGIYLIENEANISNMFPFINVMLCMSIGIPLFFCVTIISNKKNFDKKQSLIINLSAVLILAAIYFTLPDKESTHNTSLPYIKYALYNITCHLLVSFIPFAFSKQLNAFWHYNKILFLRLFMSALYSAFIYIGLIIALSSLHLLFDVKIHDKLYAEIWIAVVGFFNTWFFVAGIPKDFDELDNIYEYPKGLKTFSQYVLLPLLGLYLIILYSYGTKILVTWNWPKGIVSYLIIFVSTLGILTFLLLHPYSKGENVWIKKASKGYYFMLFPLLVILFIAIFMRINDYGITIDRYIIVTLGIWLTIVCFHTAVGKTNIKFIPTSLAIMLILISFGPWGMFSVSERSQVNRLRTILEESKILADNKIQHETTWIKDSLPNLYPADKLKNEGSLPDSLHNEVKSILDYLDDHHGFSMIREWYKQDIDSIVNLQDLKKDRYNSWKNNEAEIYMKTMGLKYEYINTNVRSASVIDYTSAYNSILKTVTGYDYLVGFSKYSYDDKYGDKNICSFTIDSVEYNLDYSYKPTVRLSLKSKTDTVYFGLEDLANKLKTEYGNNPETPLPVSKMQLVKSGKLFEIKIEFNSIKIEEEKEGLKVKNLSGNIFIKKNNF